MDRVIYKGDIVFTPTKDKFEIYEDSYILVEDGKVAGIHKKIQGKYEDPPIKDFTGKMILPGFVDLHLHAPQYPNIGLGLDKELIPWLDTYTFPEEAKYSDIEYAEKVYSRLIKDLWKFGTTRSVVFASIHKESTELLMDLFIEAGLGAYVGKVNMDRNSIEDLTESTEESLKATEEFILEYKDKSSLVKPIITPRFVPSCSSELMDGLGKMALKYNLPIQSHICENLSEIEWVGKLHPECDNYGSVYDKYNLFGQTKSVMAHCIYNSEEEIDMMAENKVFAAHCPYSNYNLSSGIMPVRFFLDKGVPIGLGSDISGGNTLNMANVMAGAIQASKIKWLESDKKLEALTTSEAFFLGTKGGGSFFGKVGSFEEGYDFDALIIDDSTLGYVDGLSLEERIQRFIYTGDDRNILERYVKGEIVML